MATSVSRRSPSTVHPTRQQLDDLDALLKRMLDLPVNRLEDESDDEASSQAEEEVRSPSSSAFKPMRGPHHPAFSQPPEKAAAPVQYHTTPTDEADLKPRVVAVASHAPENENSALAAPSAAAEEQQTGGRPEDWVPLTSSWRPSSRTWKPLTEAWQQAQGANGVPAAVSSEIREEEKRGSGKEGIQQVSITESTVPAQRAADSPLPLFPPSPLVTAGPSAAERPTPPAPAPEWRPWFHWPLVGFNAVFDLCLEPWGPTGRWLRGSTGRALLGVLGLLCLTAAAAWVLANWIGWTS